MYHKLNFAILCFLFTMVLSVQSWAEPPSKGNDNRYNAVSYRSLPALIVAGGQGISAPFAGVSNGQLLVAGGCNFPDVPAADGGGKTFYDKVFALKEAEGTWKEVGTLPQAIAYGVSVTTSEGVICIGGSNGVASSNAVFLLSLEGDKLIRRELPSLPVALDNMAGAYGGGHIYIAGGQAMGEPSQAAYRLKYPGGRNWERLPDFPGEARVQPTGVVQNGSTGAYFFLMGGFVPANGDKQGKVHRDGFYYNPLKGTWFRTSPIVPFGTDESRSLVGAQGVASGAGHIVFFGGVNAEIFEEAINRPFSIKSTVGSEENSEAQLIALETANRTYLSHSTRWYKFNAELLIYHPITDTWVVESYNPLLARAGAAVVPWNGEWVVVNGEEKPGVRSTAVTAVRMDVCTEFGWINWTVLGAYLVGMLLLGYYFMRREGSSEDFFKGGGRIPWWAAGISIYATMLSAITYMAYPAKAYATDWTYYPMLVTILLVSFPVIRYYLPFFRRLNVTSAYEYLEHRFNAATRLMASALFIIFMVVRMALVLYLPSLALTAVTGIDIYICIVLMGLVTIVYCTMGGVEAVVWGDVVQGFILVGGAFLAVGYLVLGTEGGVSGFVQLASEGDKFRLFDWSFDYRSATFWVIILGGMANNLISYTSDQTVIQRYLTTKNESEARRSIMMNGIMSVAVSIAFFAIGAGLYTFFKTHPAELDFTMGKSDTIFPFFIMSQMPQGVAGLLIAAIFAATMSTISSNINSVSTAFSVDFFKRWHPGTSDCGMLQVARIASVVSGVLGIGIALLMATWEILSLLDFFQEILGLLSSGLGGLFLMGIFFPRISGRAALIGFLCGIATVFCTKYFTETSFLLYGFIGMMVSVGSALLVSFVVPERRKQTGLTWRTLDK